MFTKIVARDQRLWDGLTSQWEKGCIALFLVFWALGCCYRWGLSSYGTSAFAFDVVTTSEAKELNRMLCAIPPNASVSAQSALTTHLAHRTQIYNFPSPFCKRGWGTSPLALEHILNWPPQNPTTLFRWSWQIYAPAPVQYIALCPMLSSFPMTPPLYDHFVQLLLHCPQYGIVQIGKVGMLLKRAANYQQGLRKLSQATGVAICKPSDIDTAYQAWRKNQVAIDLH